MADEFVRSGTKTIDLAIDETFRPPIKYYIGYFKKKLFVLSWKNGKIHQRQLKQ